MSDTTSAGKTDDTAAACLRTVVEQERQYIRRRRPVPTGGGLPTDDEVENSLVGLSLSGGGIRSATTNLGILQALSEMGILPLVDYLSTVSGGGYIGGCLSALLSLRTGAEPGERGQFNYGTRRDLRFRTAWWAFPFRPDRRDGGRVVSHLRTHGNFLIARRGLFKRDALRAVGHLLTGSLHNILVTLLVLFTLGLGAMGLAHAMEADLGTLRVMPPPAEAACGEDAPPCPGDITWEFGSRFHKAWDDAREAFVDVRLLPAVGAGAGAALLVLVTFLLLWDWKPRAGRGESVEDVRERRLLQCAALLMTIVVVVASGSLRYFRGGTPGVGWLVVPLLVMAGARITTLLVQLLAARFGQGTVWSRSFRSLWGAFQAITTYGLLLTLLFACLPVAAYAMARMSFWTLVTPVLSAVGGRFLLPLVGSEGGATAGGRRIPPGLVRFALGALVAIVVAFVMVESAAAAVRFGFDQPRLDAWSPFWTALLASAGVLGFVAVVSDANRISPHYFYRDRLLEAYLRTECRKPDVAGQKTDGTMVPLTDAMDMRLSELHGGDPIGQPGNDAPYLLVSAAINLGGSRDLTRKDRKSGYFLFSKYYCGSTHTGFRSTTAYRRNETKLARALTISGAAVGTGMGYHTFFAQSFLAAMFNVRLGYWMANPMYRSKHEGDTHVWPLYLWREIFGTATEYGTLVNLSDGGHTGDNVGIYPLLQRRCRVIIACDAEADGDLSFGSFTEALRHAYIDLGVDVDIDLDMVRKETATGLSRSHCAIGRIRYPPCGRDPGQTGWLVYLKSSITGDEPAPMRNYLQGHPAFPHETTADQFFDDAQFESYRALGVHIAETTFGEWVKDGKVAPVLSTLRGEAAVGPQTWSSDDAWQDLVNRHSPFHAADNEQFKALMGLYSDIEQQFVDEPDLAAYYDEFEKPHSLAATPSPPRLTRHVAAMQIQLMEDAYFNLQLNLYANAPDNGGWMNLFRRWSRSPTFTQHFDRLEKTYSPAFVAFYRHYIDGWRDDEPVPHAWDVTDPAASYRGLAWDGLDRCRKARAPGLLLDRGRREI